MKRDTHNDQMEAQNPEEIKKEENQNVLESSDEQQSWKNKFVLLSADYANFKRRQEEEKINWALYAQIKLIKDLLPVIDNFERALSKKDTLSPEVQSWLKGMELVYNDLGKLLSSYGVKEIDCTGLFDPHKHEALMQVEVVGKKEGEIAEVLEKGYIINDKVIRPAKVSVSK